MTLLDSSGALEDELRRIGETRYHDKHPFHRLMNEGALTRDQIRAWALNRYYYQRTIPIKDAVILSRMSDASLRRQWRQRLLDHDGYDDDEGGLERWLRMTDDLGFARDYVKSTRGVLAGTRFAGDAYVQFVATRSLLEAITSSLTELFSPGAISVRVPALLEKYDFISENTIAYFGKRMSQAPRDADFALDYAREHATTPELRQLVCDTLRFKCSILWAQLDALYYAYVEPGYVPPGAFDPASHFGGR